MDSVIICRSFITGGSLDQYNCIPEQVLGRMAVGVVRGLSYLSNLKIMHRGTVSLHTVSVNIPLTVES